MVLKAGYLLKKNSKIYKLGKKVMNKVSIAKAKKIGM